MVRALVVGVDGSDASFLALDWAVDEAALHELPLRLVYASRWERYEEAALGLSLKRPAGEVLADNIVGAAVERADLRNADVNVSMSAYCSVSATRPKARKPSGSPSGKQQSVADRSTTA
ncbi:universal stress protein [Streptomyces platensis]|uniref:universal stress protein n=1 Tax=Streptomyces platensis TaxID=58346 RepID=UPI003F4D2427